MFVTDTRTGGPTAADLRALVVAAGGTVRVAHSPHLNTGTGPPRGLQSGLSRAVITPPLRLCAHPVSAHPRVRSSACPRVRRWRGRPRGRTTLCAGRGARESLRRSRSRACVCGRRGCSRRAHGDAAQDPDPELRARKHCAVPATCPVRARGMGGEGPRVDWHYFVRAGCADLCGASLRPPPAARDTQAISDYAFPSPGEHQP